MFFDLLFGAIGSGYLVYAKRQYSGAFAIAGALLIIFPYFVSNAILECAIGAALSAAPFIAERLS